MASDLRIQGEVVLDSSKAETSMDRLGSSAGKMAVDMQQAGENAGKAVGKIGEIAQANGEKFTRSESAVVASIKRLALEAAKAQPVMDKLGNIEFNIAAKGLDSAKFKPMLDVVQQVSREAQAAATTITSAAIPSLDRMGLSAKQTAAALRGVPAQFTDIIASLQGGQAPLTVFLQQGGQLKDMFGGAGNAARALGGYVAGLVNPFTVAAAAIASIAVAYKQGSAEADGYRMALVMTGNAAGTTAAQMQQMAGRISSVVGTQGAAAEALAQMASSGRVASQSLEYFSEVAIKFERTTGTAISETVKRFAELGASPVDASRKLNEETNYLTASIYEQIKALKDQGREADAAALAQNTYADALNNRSAQITQNLGAIEGAWKAIKDAAKSGWDAMLNVGRADSLGTQIDNMRAKIAQAKGQDKNRPFSMPWDTSLADLEKQLSYLTEQERVIRRGAEAQAQRTQAEKEAIAATDALQKTQASGLTNQQKMNKALEEYARHIEKLKATNPASVLLSPDAIARGEKAIRDQFSDKGKGSAGIKAVNKDLADQAKLIAELNGLTGSFAKDWDNLSAVYARGGMSMEQLVESQAALLAKQPFAVALAKEEAAATQATSKAYADAAAERIKTIQSMERAADSLQSQNDSLREEIELIGLSTEQQTLVLQQRNDVIILTKEATLAELERQSAVTGTQTRVEIALAAEIAALKERNALLGAKAGENAALDLEKANAEAAKKAQEDWERAAEQINSTLTDALMRGFESGKDFAKNLRDTVVNMFKTMVLRPVISAIINPISGALTGMMGLSGAAQAGQGAGGALSTIGSIGSGYSMLSSLGTFGGGLSAGFGGLMGSLGMSATGATFGGAMSAGSIAMGAGNIAGGLGTLAGALGPIALAVGLLSSLIKKSTPHTGGIGAYSAASGATTGSSVGLAFGIDQKHYNQAGEDLSTNVAKSIVGILDATATTFGKQAGYYAATAFADDSSKDGAWGALRIKFGEKVLLDWADTAVRDANVPREFADGEAGSKEYLAAVAKSARDALVQAIGSVDWATDMLKGLGESVSLESLAQTVQQINAAKAAFVGFGQYMPAFASLADSAVSALVKASGGVDALASNMSVFVDGFYTDAEKLAVNTENVRAAMERLGFEMPATRDEYKALVQAQIALGDAGATTAAGLLAVSGAFAAVVPAAEAAASGVDAISDTLRRLQSDTASLQVDLLRAQGDTAGADAAKRAIDTSGMTEAEIAVYDYNASIRAQISALNELAAAAEQQTERMAQASASRWDIENEILRLQGRGAEAVAREREAELATLSALDPALVGLQRELYALRDAADAAADATADAAANVGTATREDQMTAVRDLLSRAGLQQVDATRGPGFPDTLDVFQMPVFVKGLQDFYSSFVRPDEEKANLTGALESQLAALGREMFTSPDEYKDLVKGLSEELADSYGTWIQTYTKNVNGEDTLLASVDQDKLDAYNAKQSELVRLMGLSGMVAEVLGTELENAAAAGKSLADVARERAGLEMQLFTLTGNTAAIRERELAALDPSNRIMQERIWLLEDEKRIAEERNSLMTSLYQSLGNTGALRADQLGKLDPANRALQEQVWQIDDAKAALEKALQAEAESANAAQQAAQERVSTLKSIFDTLKSNVDSLYESVEATKAWGAAQANAFIDNALGNARATGYMPEADDLTDAISGARAGLDKPYATEFEKQRDTLVLAGKLAELQDISGGQLTVAEQQLKASEAQVEALDGMQAQGKALLESLSGNTVATLSIADAIANLSAAVLGAQAAATARSIALAQGAAPANSYRTTVDQFSNGTSANRIYGGSGSIILDVGSDWSQQRIADQIRSNLSIFGQRTDRSDYEALLAYARGKGIPGFAVGTNYVPRDMLAQIHEGEAIVPKAYNPAAGGTQNNARLEALIEGLTARVQALQSELVAIKTNTSNMAENLDEVTEGGNAMRSRAVGVTA